MKETKERKKYVIVSDEGIVGAKGMDFKEVMSMLMYAYLRIWNDEFGEIDTLDAAQRIIDTLDEITGPAEEDEELEAEAQELADSLDRIVARLFGKDDDE